MPGRPAASNVLRIIGGEHGGRKLRFPSLRGLRPTGDRTRETLFNWLQPVIKGSHCLDMFAGSGALGFEAASRGAASVTMIEQQGAAVRQLQENIGLLQLSPGVEVVRDSSPAWLAKSSRRFDIVFLDPPFADNLLQECIDALQNGDHLAAEALVYLERDAHQALPELPGNWQVLRDKKQGQVAFSLVKVEKP